MISFYWQLKLRWVGGPHLLYLATTSYPLPPLTLSLYCTRVTVCKLYLLQHCTLLYLFVHRQQLPQ